MAVVSGGAGLERKMREIAKGLNKKKVRVGFIDGATYPDGTQVAEVAAIQNFGAPAAGIPPRPFFSNMVEEKSPGWGEKAKRLLRHTGGDGDAALMLLGEGIAGQLRQSIVDTNAPPLKPATVRRKGFEKPLVESGLMLGSIDVELSE